MTFEQQPFVNNGLYFLGLKGGFVVHKFDCNFIFRKNFSLGIKKSVASQTTVLATAAETDTIDRCIDEELERYQPI